MKCYVKHSNEWKKGELIHLDLHRIYICSEDIEVEMYQPDINFNNSGFSICGFVNCNSANTDDQKTYVLMCIEVRITKPK